MRWLVLFLLPLCLFADVHFLLIRHGETDWNTQHRMQGITDNPLNEKGLLQADLLAEKLVDRHSDMAAIYASDLQRASVTARATASRLALPVVEKTSFREYDWGEVDGWKVEQVYSKYNEEIARMNEAYPIRKERWDHTVFPGAETFNGLLNRFRDQLIEVAKDHPDRKVAIFSHARSIRTMMANLMDREVQSIQMLQNCEAVSVYFSPETGTFRLGEVESFISPQLTPQVK